MSVLDILTSPIAMLEAPYRAILELYDAHMRGDKIDLEAMEAATAGRRTRVDGYTYIQQGIGVVELFGPLTKRAGGIANACMHVTSTALATQRFKALVEDPEVKAIIIHADSPGGSVDGTMDMAQAVYQARGSKPIVTFADGCMVSAMYWIGAAADRVLIANETTYTGSIGVFCIHEDRSEADAKAGIKKTEFVYGKYKRQVGDGPLSEEAKASLQDRVDTIGSLFVNDVARFRGVSPDAVIERMAEGRVFMGSKGIAAGLADGVSSLDQLIAELAQGRKPGRSGAGAALNQKPTSKEASMTLTREELAAQEGGQDLINALIEEGKTQGAATAKTDAETLITTAREEGKAEGRSAEAARVKAIFAKADGLEGHDALVREMVLDGKTTPEQASDRVLAAEKAAIPLRRIKREAPTPVPFGGEPGAEGSDPAAALRARWESNSSIQNLYGTFEVYQKACEVADTAAKSGRIHMKRGDA